MHHIMRGHIFGSSHLWRESFEHIERDILAAIDRHQKESDHLRRGKRGSPGGWNNCPESRPEDLTELLGVGEHLAVAAIVETYHWT